MRGQIAKETKKGAHAKRNVGAMSRRLAGMVHDGNKRRKRKDPKE